MDDDVLRTVGVDRASSLVACLATDEDNVFVTIGARALNPDLKVVAKCAAPTTENKLRLAGAESVVQVPSLGGFQLASEVLRPDVTAFVAHLMRDTHRRIGIEELGVESDSPYAGLSLGRARIREAADVLVIAIRQRDGGYLYNPGPDTLIDAGSSLIVIGGREELNALKR